MKKGRHLKAHLCALCSYLGNPPTCTPTFLHLPKVLEPGPEPRQALSHIPAIFIKREREVGMGVECARTLGSATTLKQAWLNARKLRGLQSVRNRKHNRRLQRGQLGMPRSTPQRRNLPNNQENQPGPFGLLKMELLQRDYLLSASRPVRMNDYTMLS